MTIHREGYKSIAIVTLLFAVINVLMFWFFGASVLWLCVILFFISLVFLLFVVSFFRIPARKYTVDDHAVVSPCDGKVVVIEEITVTEYFKDNACRYLFL